MADRDQAERDIGAAIFSLRMDGHSWREIAVKLGVSHMTVKRWHAEHDARMRAEGWDF